MHLFRDFFFSLLEQLNVFTTACFTKSSIKVIILPAHKWLSEASEIFILLRPRIAARWIHAITLPPAL